MTTRKRSFEESLAEALDAKNPFAGNKRSVTNAHISHQTPKYIHSHDFSSTSYMQFAADHIFKTARLYLPDSEYSRIILILRQWKQGVIHRLMAEYIITDIAERTDLALGTDVRQYFEYATQIAEKNSSTA